MIRLDDSLIGGIRKHAQLAYPHECCGALLGRAIGDDKHVAAIEPVDNRRDGDAARRRFLITADDYRAIESVARRRNLDVVGFYHSHPDHPAHPSDFDREHALPWLSYVIVAVSNGDSGELTSWVLDDDRSRFTQEALG